MSSSHHPSLFAPLLTLWLSIGCALFSLYQGQRVYQNTIQDWLLEQSIEQRDLKSSQALETKLNQFNSIPFIQARWLVTSPSSTTESTPSYLHDLVNPLTQEKNQSKEWFDAFWSPTRSWTDKGGQVWKRFQGPSDFSSVQSNSPSNLDLDPSLSRIMISIQRQAPPSVFWTRWIGIGFFLSFLFWGINRKLPSAGWGGCLYLGVGGLVIASFSLFHISSIEHSYISFQKLLERSSYPSWPYAHLVLLVSLLPLMGLAILHSFTYGRKSPHRVAYTYMAPTLLSVSILVFVPFSLGVGLAFMRYDQGSFTWVGLSHFIEILFTQDYALNHPLNFYFTLAVTLLWTATNVFLHASIGLAFALLLNKKGLYLSGMYRVLLIIPWAIPNYITALIWKGMFNQQYGLINHLLSLVGIEPVGWMSHFWGAFSANVITNTWLGFPFMMVVALGALQSIPKDLYEAADLAGASPWVQFKSITLPLLKPALLPAIILGSVWTFNMFNIIYLVSGGHPNGATDILITEAYRWAFEQDRYGYASAYSLVIFFILLGYAGLSQKLAKSAEEVYL